MEGLRQGGGPSVPQWGGSPGKQAPPCLRAVLGPGASMFLAEIHLRRDLLEPALLVVDYEFMKARTLEELLYGHTAWALCPRKASWTLTVVTTVAV